MRARLRWLLPLLALLLASCQSGGPAPWEHRFTAMGSEFRLLIPGAETRNPQPIFQAVEDLMRRLEAAFDPWGNGELAAMNRTLAQGSSVQVSDELAGLLRQAQTLSAVSEGWFDPGIGALVELWGFHRLQPGALVEPPSDAAIAAVLAGCVGIRHLRIRGREVSSDCAGPTIDLGTIAKGYAVDQAMTLIRNLGVAHALLDAGGDVRAMGRNGREPWRIGIQNPSSQDPSGPGLAGSVALATGEAIFTAGAHQRYVVLDGQRYAPVLDPFTGHPVAHTASVTVLAGQGRNAHPASTAIFAAGPERWRDIGEKLGVRAVLRMDAAGRIEITTTLDRRLESASARVDLIAGAGNETL